MRGEDFNEAAGIHRRKHENTALRRRIRILTSMRPPEFTGGNVIKRDEITEVVPKTSMRPPEFTGGNRPPVRRRVPPGPRTSMRPPEFTGGNCYPTKRYCSLRCKLQ